MAANERFVAEGSTIGAPDWKLVRAKEGVQVYRQRKRAIKQYELPTLIPPVPNSMPQPKEYDCSRYRTSSTRADSEAEHHASSVSSSGIAGDSIMEKMRPPGVALMALHGTMDGTLDDCLFGCVAASDEAWMLRSSHINDRLDDARMIASIRVPTRMNPCRFVGVKWFAKEHPVVLTGIVHQRDFLILESTGFTRDSKGERVGYILMHSVTLPEIPELTHMGIVRGVMSFCYIFRQGGPNKVDIFCRGFFDSCGEMPGRLSVAIAADAAICCTGVVDYAYIKKLRWLMKHACKPPAETTTQSSNQQCDTCAMSCSKFALPLFKSDTPCQICRKMICSKCIVKKKMTMHVSDSGSFQQCALYFCLRCLQLAKEKSSQEMALKTLESTSTSFTSFGSTSMS